MDDGDDDEGEGGEWEGGLGWEGEWGKSKMTGEGDAG